MGDIVSLVEKAAENIDQEKALRAVEKMRKGKFDLDDLRDQLAQMDRIGGMGGVMGMLPGMGKMKAQIEQAGLGDGHDPPPAGHHRLDDRKGAPQPRPPQGLAQEAHRGRLRAPGSRRSTSSSRCTARWPT